MNLYKARVDKKIPKNRFHFAMPEIESIIWRYKIAKSTLGIGDSDEYKELQVFCIRFHGNPTIKYFSKIQAAIPYRILFEYEEAGAMRYAIVVGAKTLTTKSLLLNGEEMAVSALTVKTFYECIVEKVSEVRRKEDESIEAFVSRQAEIEHLKAEIEKTKRLVNTEKQSKKRFEYNDELKVLKNKLRELQGE